MSKQSEKREEGREGLVPLRGPEGCTSAAVSRPYRPDADGVFWVTPDDAVVLMGRHGFELA